jgi:nitrite reductase (NADH) large subunit
VVDDASMRAELYARFLQSQTSAQIDPWKARAEGKDAPEYVPLMAVAEMAN